MVHETKTQSSSYYKMVQRTCGSLGVLLEQLRDNFDLSVDARVDQLVDLYSPHEQEHENQHEHSRRKASSKTVHHKRKHAARKKHMSMKHDRSKLAPAARARAEKRPSNLGTDQAKASESNIDDTSRCGSEGECSANALRVQVGQSSGVTTNLSNRSGAGYSRLTP